MWTDMGRHSGDCWWVSKRMVVRQAGNLGRLIYPFPCHPDTNNLARFHRYPDQLVAYKTHLAHVQAMYGSVQRYVREELLGWDEAVEVSESSADGGRRRRPADVIRWSACPHVEHRSEASNCRHEAHFRGLDGEYKILPTPFPYAIPAGTSIFASFPGILVNSFQLAAT
jgi:hypothetical protein